MYKTAHRQSFYRLQQCLFFMLILKGIFGGPCDGHVNLTEEYLSHRTMCYWKSHEARMWSFRACVHVQTWHVVCSTLHTGHMMLQCTNLARGMMLQKVSARFYHSSRRFMALSIYHFYLLGFFYNDRWQCSRSIIKSNNRLWNSSRIHFRIAHSQWTQCK